MRYSIAAVGCLVLCSACVGSAMAQTAFPDQFYTNGEKVDAWKRDPGADFMVTLWFARRTPTDLGYRQVIIYVYDAEPDNPYYQDAVTKRFVGRFDERSGGYSMLPAEFRRTELQDIPASAFPPPGQMPTLGQMLRALGEAESNNDDSMMKPPVTKVFPRLQTSTWDSYYVAEGGQRVRVTVSFNGPQGSYRLSGSNQQGTLSNITYQRLASDVLMISGHWSLGRRIGQFRFRVAPDNLNAFQGEWGFERPTGGGIWDGVRTSR